MKILIALVYLILLAVSMSIIAKRQKATFKHLRGDKVNMLVMTMFSYLVLLISYVQFWILTGVFPVYFILTLLLVVLLANGIYGMVGAIAGFTVKEKKDKILGLSAIYGATNSKIGCLFLIVGNLVLLASVTGTLWVYFKYPKGSADQVLWVALFHFTLSNIFSIIFSNILSWKIMTSEFADDDIRNSYLTTKFTEIFSSILTLFFPLWLFKEHLTGLLEKNNIYLPHLWLMLSIPFAIFILTALFPFFLGMYKYRSQTKAMLEWRKAWLKNLITDLKLPKGNVQSEKLNVSIRTIEIRIKKEIDENELYKFYKEKINTGFAKPVSKWQQRLEKMQTAQQGISQGGAGVIQDISIEDEGTNENDQLLVNTQFTNIEIIKSSEDGLYTGEDVTSLTLHYIQSQNKNLVNWDLRYKNIYVLMNIYKVVKSVDPNDVKEYLETEAVNIEKEEKSFRTGKNILAGAIISIFTAVFIWLFKIFEDDIIHFFRNIVINQQ
ncbi:MAG: hypothetical protein ABIR15_15175 [Chitinophagaceae bacterium]